MSEAVTSGNVAIVLTYSATCEKRSCRGGVRVKQEVSSESIYKPELNLFSRSSIGFLPPRLTPPGILDAL